MGLSSKLFKSSPPATSPDEAPAAAPPSAEVIRTPQVMDAYIPPAARPTPIDVHDRETVPRIDALLVHERPTVVTPVAAPARPVPPPLPTPPTADDLDEGFAAIE